MILIHYLTHKSFHSLDGCNSNAVDDMLWTESNIGEIVQLPCPCEQFLKSGQMANRVCGGTYSQGGQWKDVNYNQCDSVTIEVTSQLCSIATQVRMK